jgi:hypothetical protein
MPSALSLIKKMEINTPVKGIAGLALDSAIGFGTSYGLGRVYRKYNDKWYGKSAPKIAAAVGKAGAVLFSVFGGGRQNFLGAVANSIGQAGVNAMGLDLGLKHENASTGMVAKLVPKHAAALTAAPTAVGALGAAAPGKGLSWAQIEELAASH